MCLFEEVSAGCQNVRPLLTNHDLNLSRGRNIRYRLRCGRIEARSGDRARRHGRGRRTGLHDNV